MRRYLLWSLFVVALLVLAAGGIVARGLGLLPSDSSRGRYQSVGR